MGENAIITRGLTREFGSVRAVDGLSLEVPAGTVFGFLGLNGSGKTTTIHLLVGLLEPTSGSAEVLGYDTRAHADEIRNGSGVLLEFPGLYERLSAADNLEFCGRAWKMPAQERRERSKELLTHIGLWDRRMTASGVTRREQRARYDRLRETEIPRHGLTLVVINADDLTVDRRGRLLRDERADLVTLQRVLAAAGVELSHSPPDD